MLNKIKNIANTEDKKRLLSNFFSLSILQGANYILPLRIFPYLVRVLGVEKYGLIAFASAFIFYFNIITDYGFNLTATKEIFIHRNNKEKLNEIFNAVLIIKLSLMIISFVVMRVMILNIEKFKEYTFLYLLSFGKLPYRSVKMKFETIEKDFFQKTATVSYPNNYDFTRIIEFKNIYPVESKKTTILKEYQKEYIKGKDTPYYPIFTDKNQEKYNKYLDYSKRWDNLILVGRLAEYKYYEMDDIVEKALEVFEEKIKV